MSLFWRRAFDPTWEEARRELAFPAFPLRWSDAPIGGANRWLPANAPAPLGFNVDMWEEGDGNLRLKAEIPGVQKNDIKVSVEDNSLCIRAEKQNERHEDQENYHYSERSYGRLQRYITLPFSVDPATAKASFDNGVLEIGVNRSAQESRTKQLTIQ